MANVADVKTGFTRKKTQDWFNENNEDITRLIDAKHRTRLVLKKHPAADNKQKYQEAEMEEA